MKSWYDKEEDILNIQIEKKDYWKSIELPNGIILDIDKGGNIIAIEVQKASKVLLGDGKKVIEAAKPVVA